MTLDHRRKRVAERLLTELLRKVQHDSTLEQIQLAVAAGQNAARQLYRKLGFETFGREPRSLKVASTYIDEDHMILRLNR